MTRAITAEQALGEYWKDPLFGQAAAEYTVNLEVLHRRIWPMQMTVPAGKNIRFIVQNKTSETHLIAFSVDAEMLLEDAEFQKFAEDELFHAQQKAQQSAGSHHHHNGSGGSVEETQDIVKTLNQKPTVLVLPNEQKEMLVLFAEEQVVSIFCAIDGHKEEGYISQLKIKLENRSK